MANYRVFQKKFIEESRSILPTKEGKRQKFLISIDLLCSLLDIKVIHDYYVDEKKERIYPLLQEDEETFLTVEGYFHGFCLNKLMAMAKEWAYQYSLEDGGIVLKEEPIIPDFIRLQSGLACVSETDEKYYCGISNVPVTTGSGCVYSMYADTEYKAVFLICHMIQHMEKFNIKFEYTSFNIEKYYY